MSGKFAGLGLAVEAPSRLTLVHPVTGQVLRDSTSGDEAWIDLLAATSTVGRAHDRAVADRVVRMRGQRYTNEQAEADLVEKLAKLTKGWSLMSLDGTPVGVEFSAVDARALYALPETAWLREQVVGFVNDLGNFQQPASKN